MFPIHDDTLPSCTKGLPRVAIFADIFHEVYAETAYGQEVRTQDGDSVLKAKAAFGTQLPSLSQRPEPTLKDLR